jgi:hypothetical protein
VTPAATAVVSLVDTKVPASQWATGLLQASAVLEAAEIDSGIAKFIVAGDEQHTSSLALLRPLVEVRHSDRVERLNHPGTGCVRGHDDAGTSPVEIQSISVSPSPNSSDMRTVVAAPSSPIRSNT